MFYYLIKISLPTKDKEPTVPLITHYLPIISLPRHRQVQTTPFNSAGSGLFVYRGDKSNSFVLASNTLQMLQSTGNSYS